MAETSAGATQTRKEVGDERIVDAHRPVGNTTRGDPAKQHIPRLEELQREADERNQRERTDTRGWAKIFGTLFVALLAIGIIDRALTSFAGSIATWFR